MTTQQLVTDTVRGALISAKTLIEGKHTNKKRTLREIILALSRLDEKDRT